MDLVLPNRHVIGKISVVGSIEILNNKNRTEDYIYGCRFEDFFYPKNATTRSYDESKSFGKFALLQRGY